MAIFAVGSKVRVPLGLPNHPRATRQAVIATLQEDQAAAVVIFEDEFTVSPQDDVPFLVAPNIASEPSNNNTIEATIPFKSLSQLLTFEKTVLENEDLSSAPLLVWKERGDELFRLHDHNAAAFFYEKVLRLTSDIQIGATVLVKAATGHVVTAEIDCIDEDDQVDISFLESGEEATFPKSKILLAVDDGDSDSLQERILLNLTRCLLQLAETTSTKNRRPLYFRSAVLGCTLALALSDLHSKNVGNANVSSNTPKTALLLRSQAQAGLQKFPHAKADLKRLLALDPDHKEGLRQMQLLERQKAKVAKTNKRLAKDVSHWVQAAMDKTGEKGNGSVSENDMMEGRECERPDQQTDATKNVAGPPWLSLMLVVLFAWFLQKQFG